MIPFLNRTPGSPISVTGKMGPGTAGRPLRNGKFSLRPVSDDKSGFKQLNTMPDVLLETHKKYLKSGQLPPSLMPKHAQPQVLRDRKNKNISRGWKKPMDGRGR